MGGGKSFGKQRHSLNQQAAPRPAQPPASTPSPAGGGAAYLQVWPQAVSSSRPMQFSGLNAGDNVNTPPIQSLHTTTTSGSTQPQGNIPADFKVAPFLRNAKVSFIRLQAAHDAGDINDYTTSEMLAEISMQINEHGLNQQKTEVMSIDADLLDVETTDDLAVASVRFNGQLRQGENGDPEDFDEIWHVQKDFKDADAVWLLAGIQQVTETSDEE